MSVHCEKCGQAKYLASLCRGLEDENKELRNQLTAARAELEKTKEALRLSNEGRPSEWAYTQLLNDFKAARIEIERLKDEKRSLCEASNESTFNYLALRNERDLERKITAMLREALKECRLSAENHTGLNSKSVIMRVYDTSREALAREQSMRNEKK